jgi:prephenate dehydrogenase
MAAVTQFYTIAEVARMLGEDPEMLEAIVSNDDNLNYGNIVSVHTGADEAITAVTGHGIEELREMILDARRSPQEWHNFLEDFVSNPDIIARVKDKGPR